MNIVYIATNSYLSMLGISLFSLLENTGDMDTLHIHVLSADLAPDSTQQLVSLVKHYHREITFYDVSDYKSFFSFDFQTSGFHSIVLARLLLAKYLPETIDSLLYLDCDVIIHDSLLPLKQYESSMLNASCNHSGIAFAAVPELCMPDAQKLNIGLSADDTYYNCGVLLINLRYWREHQLHQEFIDYYASMQGNLLYNDQDILNHCCCGNILSLPHTYNFSPALYYFPRYFIRKYQPAYYCKTKQEYNNIIKHPAIIHFLGDERPWFHGNFSPYRKVYEHYKCRSPWSSESLIYGRELHLFLYHMLNCITRICPWFRKLFTKYIGIYYYKITGKK